MHAPPWLLGSITINKGKLLKMLAASGVTMATCFHSCNADAEFGGEEREIQPSEKNG